jgi:hypothetical protein
MEWSRTLRASAAVLAGLTVAMVGATAWLSLVGGAWAELSGSVRLESVLLVSHLIWPAAGLLLVLRLPRHPVGWLLVLVGVGYGLINLGRTAIVYTHLVLERPSVVSEVLAVAGDAFVGLAVAGGWILLFLLFPDGSLPSPRWRWVGWLAVASGVGYLVVALFARAPVYYLPSVDNPMGSFGGPQLFHAAELVYSIILAVIGLPAAVAALVVRWRRSGTVQRQQLKWLLWAAVLLAFALLAASPVHLRPGPGELEDLVDATIAAASAAVPVAILLAITRYRLFEIDRIVSRTVSYAVVAGVLLAVYAGGVLAMQVLVPTSGDLAVAAATLTAAALFNPLRRKVHTRVDRSFNRNRYSAEQELARFADRLRDTVELDDITADVEGVVARTVQPSVASIWIREVR